MPSAAAAVAGMRSATQRRSMPTRCRGKTWHPKILSMIATPTATQTKTTVVRGRSASTSFAGCTVTRARTRRTRNILFGLVILRSLQLSALAWVLGYVVSGPIAERSLAGMAWGVAAYLVLAAWTNLMFHFRQRLALELGECVVHDLRDDIFAHLQRMSMRFFHRTKLGRVISRVTSDAEAVRAGVQDVVFTSLVGLGQMLVAASLMFFYDPVLFLVVAGDGAGDGLAELPLSRPLEPRIARSTRALAASQPGWSKPYTACRSRRPSPASARRPAVPRAGGRSFEIQSRSGAHGGRVRATFGAQQPGLPGSDPHARRLSSAQPRRRRSPLAS